VESHLLPQDGRFGQNRGGTFVPAKGRPFGDVQRALNATERLVLIGGDPMEQRDYAVRPYPHPTHLTDLGGRDRGALKGEPLARKTTARTDMTISSWPYNAPLAARVFHASLHRYQLGGSRSVGL
jgi:hypothetical protein